MGIVERGEEIGGAAALSVPVFDFIVWLIDNYSRAELVVKLHDQLPTWLITPITPFVCMWAGLGLLYLSQKRQLRHVAATAQTGIVDASGQRIPPKAVKPGWLIPFLLLVSVALVVTTLMSVIYSLRFQGSLPPSLPHQLPPAMAYIKPNGRPIKRIKPKMVQMISAPNGIAIGGGIVSNPTVNNYGPELPHVSWSIVNKRPLANAANPEVWVHITIDRDFINPKFAVICDRPCKAVGGAITTNAAGGYIQDSWGSVPNSPNIAAYVINGPNPMPYDATYDACVESNDSQPPHIIDVRTLTIRRPP